MRFKEIKMKSVAIFCGSSSGNLPIFEETAYEAGKYLASQKCKVIYGGGKVGLMGKSADGAMENGGEVIGVLPKFMDGREVGHKYLNQLIWVKDMHERKTKMYDLSEGIIGLSGGFGTMDEMFESLTWGQLGLHEKPIGFLNLLGYYDHLFAQMDKMVEYGFLNPVNRSRVIIGDTIESLYQKMTNFEPIPAVWH